MQPGSWVFHLDSTFPSQCSSLLPPAEALSSHHAEGFPSPSHLVPLPQPCQERWSVAMIFSCSLKHCLPPSTSLAVSFFWIQFLCLFPIRTGPSHLSATCCLILLFCVLFNPLNWKISLRADTVFCRRPSSVRIITFGASSDFMIVIVPLSVPWTSITLSPIESLGKTCEKNTSKTLSSVPGTG